jgi:DNA-binding transcriptional LysR family regulator
MITATSQPADDLAVTQLRAFCVVFERESFSAAARQLGLAAPTVWEQVRSLERRYQAVLFTRRGRRIEPTQSATLLFQSLSPLLAGLDSTFDLVREQRGDFARTLTIVTGARMMLEDLAPPLAQFRRKYPSVCLRLLHRNATAAAEELVLAGQADLALTLEPGPGVASRGVSVERAYPIDYLAIFPRRHPLARQRSLRLAAIVKHPLIVGHSGTYGRQLLEQALHHEGLSERTQIVAETDTSAFTIACVRSGMGVGIVAGQAGGFLVRGLATRSLAPQLGQAWIAFLWKKGRQLTPTVQALVQFIRQRRLAGKVRRGAF